jgi:hypothetical protein
MKRLILVLCLSGLMVALSASSAFGIAANFNYAGNVKGSPNERVFFFLKHTSSGRKKVLGFTVLQIPYRCSDAPSGTTGGWQFTKRMRVNKRHRTFEGRGAWVDLPLDPVGKVSGKFRHGGKAVGDFKLRGELAGGGTHCHTGLLKWRAKKQPPPA